METSYVKIGTILKPHAVKGEVKIQIDAPFIPDFLKSPIVFLEMQGNKAPFFIPSQQNRNEEVLKLEDIDTREAAARLYRKDIYLRRQDLSFTPEEEAAEENFTLLIGFSIQDQEKGTIGQIEEVLELPQQWMAVVVYDGRELLIPLNETFILGIEPEQQIIRMNLPEGLLDL